MVLQVLIAGCVQFDKLFGWWVNALAVAPFEVWPEECRRDAEIFREAGGRVEVRKKINVRKMFPDEIAYDYTVVVPTTNVGFWDVHFNRKSASVWTAKDVVDVFGPPEAVRRVSKQRMDFQYTHGGTWSDKVRFIFEHGVLTSVSEIGFIEDEGNGGDLQGGE